MPLIRVLIGLIFLVSGFEKLISPYQNFLYAIQAYQALPSMLEKTTAIFFPWIEFITGIFLVLGLWTPWVLRLAIIMFAAFIVIVGQALLRGINIDSCGCFGSNIHIPPRFIIVMDSVMLLASVCCLKFMHLTQRFSLDVKLK